MLTSVFSSCFINKRTHYMQVDSHFKTPYSSLSSFLFNKNTSQGPCGEKKKEVGLHSELNLMFSHT